MVVYSIDSYWLCIFNLTDYTSYSIKVKRQDVYKRLEFEKGTRDRDQSKQTSNHLKPVTRNISYIGYNYNSKANAHTSTALSS